MTDSTRTYRIMRTGRGATHLSRTTSTGQGVHLWHRHGHVYDLELEEAAEVAGWPDVLLTCIDRRGPYVPATPQPVAKDAAVTADDAPEAAEGDAGGTTAKRGRKKRG